MLPVSLPPLLLFLPPPLYLVHMLISMVLLSLPDDRQIAEITSRGDLVARVLPEYGLMFAELAEKLKQELGTTGGTP